VSIAPSWDGNEAWLVLGSAGAVGRLAARLCDHMPALYLPVIVMLPALVFGRVSLKSAVDVTNENIGISRSPPPRRWHRRSFSQYDSRQRALALRNK